MKLVSVLAILSESIVNNLIIIIIIIFEIEIYLLQTIFNTQACKRHNKAILR